MEARLDGPFFYCKQAQVTQAARALARVADLSLQARPCFYTDRVNCRVNVCFFLVTGCDIPAQAFVRQACPTLRTCAVLFIHISPHP